jgi:hypothetical protein
MSVYCSLACFDGRPPTALRVSGNKQSHIEPLDLKPQVVPFYWTVIMDMASLGWEVKDRGNSDVLRMT